MKSEIIAIGSEMLTPFRQDTTPSISRRSSMS